LILRSNPGNKAEDGNGNPMAIIKRNILFDKTGEKTNLRRSKIK
jgi:hypothetical protein